MPSPRSMTKCTTNKSWDIRIKDHWILGERVPTWRPFSFRHSIFLVRCSTFSYLLNFSLSRGGGIGRRTGLKIQRWQQREGSIPSLGTMLRPVGYAWHANIKLCGRSMPCVAESGARVMFYVYILRSEADSEKTYVGFTSNLKERLARHNCDGESYTAKYRPWKIIFYSAFDDKKRALEFERYLKSHSGKAFAGKHLV